MSPVLEVRDLVTRFSTDAGVVRAVNGLSYTLEAGEALALVGESGSGKSVGALSVLGLVQEPWGRVESGSVRFEGRELLSLDAAELRRVRGRKIAMIFQDPATSLNPVLTVGMQVAEGPREHLGLSKAAARAKAADLLALVGIPDAKARLSAYPHELSGGQRQRVMIAMAIACEPAVLIADEPTTALDVTIQAQIVDLMKRLQRTLGMAILWITHDLALAAGIADNVAVMYAGAIIEAGMARDLFRRPRHPYTLGLLGAMPHADRSGARRLTPIPGAPPDLRREWTGCAFAARCPHVVDRCRQENPPLFATDSGTRSACWRWEEL